MRLPQKEVQRGLLHRCGVQLYKMNVRHDIYSCTCFEHLWSATVPTYTTVQRGGVVMSCTDDICLKIDPIIPGAPRH